jgi:predicted DNA-binding antitoxin AbrB/MazE fold protein
MSEIVTAVYENGLLRPLRPLNLRERQTVRIQVLPEEPAGEAEEVIQGLVEAGLLTAPPGYSDVEPLSAKERRELAEALGRAPGKPLSEIIIEERGEW